jgi:spermidine synthase
MKASRAAVQGIPRQRIALLYSISGFCFLAIETIWIRTLSYQMGGTAFSSSVIISVFFASAALGNLWAGRRIRATENPLAAYGRCEIACAGLAAVAFAARPWAEFLTHGIDTSALKHIAYAVCFVALPSFFSGASFPFLSQALAAAQQQRVMSAGPVYAANLLGAAAGLIVGGVWLPEAAGYSVAFYVLCALAALTGCAAVRLSRSWTLARAADIVEKTETATVPRGEGLGIAVLIASGVLSILLEVLCITYVLQFTSHSRYSVNAALFAFIVNFGAGSYLAAILIRRKIAVEKLLAAGLALSGLACAVYPALIHAAMQAGFPLVSPYSAGSIAALMIATALLLAPLLIPAGLVFPLAWSLVRRGAAQGEALSLVAVCNKFGSALGAFAGSFVLFPAIGLPKTMAVCGAAYLALAMATLLQLDVPSRGRLFWLVGSTAGMVLAAAIFATVPAPVSIRAPNKLVASYQGADGVVAVSEDQNGSRHIVVNNSYVLNGTERALRSQKQECWLPLALCERPRRVAFIGMASGISATAALDFPLEHLDAIELVPEVVRAAKENFGAWNARLFSDPRAAIRINDGRCVIQSAAEAYDLIICDLMFKEHEGTSSLYSRDFFNAASAKLSANGRFCLWLPLYQLDQRLTSVVIRTFLDVFPNAIAMRGNLDPLQPTMALIGASEPIDVSSEFLGRQLEREHVKALSSECAFLRSVSNFRLTLVGDLRSVAAEFERFPLNTDDAPIFAFEGPRVIPNGESLRGFTFLNAFGKRFLKPDYPSCRLGETPPEELLAGISAGNHVFAASVSAVDLPMEAEKQLQRVRQTMEHLQLAGKISPHAEVRQADLGQ